MDMIEILSTRDPFCRKFATSCLAYFLNPQRRGEKFSERPKDRKGKTDFSSDITSKPAIKNLLGAGVDCSKSSAQLRA